jgi:hypothetical protein
MALFDNISQKIGVNKVIPIYDIRTASARTIVKAIEEGRK